jgi:hypothetical protein
MLILFQFLDNSLDFFVLVLEVLEGFLDEGRNLQHLFGVVGEVDSELGLVLEAETLDLVTSMLLYLFYSVLEVISFFHDSWDFLLNDLLHSRDEFFHSLNPINGSLENISFKVIKFHLYEGSICRKLYSQLV